LDVFLILKDTFSKLRIAERGGQRQLANQAPELLKAIPGAGNCLWQLPAYNQATAILRVFAAGRQLANQATRRSQFWDKIA
jgi:hypothetical protein